MGFCHLCSDSVNDADLFGHMEGFHAIAATRWPDGSLVVIDETLAADDFAGGSDD